MPTPNATTPKTHRIAIDLDQIVSNIQRATEHVFGVGATPRRRPEYPAPTEKFECHIGTMDKLQEFLQPAMESSLADYSRKTYNGQWVHILNFGDGAQKKHRILLMPTTILNTFSNERCSIDQGLAYYLNVALDVAPPSSAIDDTDALMTAYILFFGAGYMINPDIKQFTPPIAPPPLKTVDAPPVASPIPPSVAPATPSAPVVTPAPAPAVPPVPVATPPPAAVAPQAPTGATAPPPKKYPPAQFDIRYLFAILRMGNRPNALKIQALYQQKATQYALKLARDIHRNVGQDDVAAKQLAGLIARLEPLSRRNVLALSDRELERVGGILQDFLKALFQSPAWNAQYTRFRKDILAAECVESANEPTGVCHVQCPGTGIQFDIDKANISDPERKTASR